MMRGMMGQYKRIKITFPDPKTYLDFYKYFEMFKETFKLHNRSNYEMDKFLWFYGKKLIEEISRELKIDLSKAKDELKRRIKNYI